MRHPPVPADEVDVRWVASHDWRLVIGGQVRPAQDGRVYDNVSPVTEQRICAVPDASPDDVDAAVQRGLQAFAEWKHRDVRERGQAVRGLAAALRDHKEELAALDAIDVGNAYSIMLADVEQAADMLELMADMAFNLRGETLPATTSHLHYTRREPVGVVARIVAFNHPIMFAAGKIAGPLVAGNAVLLKPSDTSPLSALRMGEIFSELLPPGTLSVLVGQGPDVPRAIVRHPAVRRIGFVGSERTGRMIQRDAAEVGVKDVSLELGGKNSMIVCPDQDAGVAAAAAVKGMNFLGWQSQSCSSTSKLLAHESVADELVAAIVEQVGEIRIGSPLRPTTQMGTLASRAQYDKTRRYIDIARADGAILVCGGGRPSGAEFARGYYVSPTVFDGVEPTMRVAREEVFGPLLSVLRWRDEEEVICLANDTSYGLTGAIMTNDLARGHRLAHSLDAGYIWINDAGPHYAGVPFGGYKASGVGKEESVEELLSYTQLKSVNVRL